jgi:CheY-like chemotaxis protein
MACDGEEGVRMAAAQEFDLILMDMQMPVLDGIAATQKIRATGNSTPIVALTANASAKDRERCHTAGMNRFESKPVTMERLRNLFQDYAASCKAPAQPAGQGQPAAPDVKAPEAKPMPSDRLSELAAVLGEDGARELVATFLADAPALLNELKDAMGANDRDRLDRVLHNLKGAALNLGFDELASMAQHYRNQPPDVKNFEAVDQAFKKIDLNFKAAA